MKKTFLLACIAILTSLVSFGYTITGTLGACVGSYSRLIVDSTTGASGGGTWSSSNTAVATLTATGFGRYDNDVYGVSAGTATISYIEGSVVSTAVVTVSASPAAITGVSHFCSGTSTTYADATAGGVWSISYTSGGVTSGIGAATGVATATSTSPYFGPGTMGIAYTVGGCAANKTVTIDVTDVGYITGTYPYTLCAGATVTATETVSGGTWSSGSPSIATINPGTGVITGVSAGTTYISYTVSGACGAASTYDTLTVLTTTPTPTISGPSMVTNGSTITLYGSLYGGTWSSGSTAIASISATSGSSTTVLGLSTGTSAISYTMSGCSGPVTATQVVTVAPFTGISGHVNFSTPVYTTMIVWLITYNTATHDLEAVDSTILNTGGDLSVYYEFLTAATDSYRVKASISFDSSYTPAGFMPTYHTSSLFWHDADVFYHTSGSSDVNKDINMIAGTSAAGAGFIAGDVTTGANRGTNAGVPNLLVYAINSATGTVVQQTYTNATGHYQFSSLPYGTYLVHPELINYATVPYTGITLSASAATMSAASFIEHTVSKVISPVNVAVSNVPTATASILAYPNPTSDKLNITWNQNTNTTGNVTLTDVTGKEVLATTINMATGAGSTQLSLNGLANGVYMLHVTAAGVDYNNKIVVSH